MRSIGGRLREREKANQGNLRLDKKVKWRDTVLSHW